MLANALKAPQKLLKKFVTVLESRNLRCLVDKGRKRLIFQ